MTFGSGLSQREAGPSGIQINQSDEGMKEAVTLTEPGGV